MKKMITVIFMFLITPTLINADVIFSPYTEHGLVLSLEGIGSYELPFSMKNTLNAWSGFGCVSAIGSLDHPAFGGEIALELRHYFSKDKFSGFNLGLYSGLAYMRYPSFYRKRVLSPKTSVGFVPGLKLAYKYRVNTWLVGEPYIGVSIPWYGDDFKELSDKISRNEPGLILTVGLRIGFNKVRSKK